MSSKILKNKVTPYHDAQPFGCGVFQVSSNNKTYEICLWGDPEPNPMKTKSFFSFELILSERLGGNLLEISTSPLDTSIVLESLHESDPMRYIIYFTHDVMSFLADKAPDIHGEIIASFQKGVFENDTFSPKKRKRDSRL